MHDNGAKANCRSVRKGSWNDEEDNLLRKCIDKFGEGNWHRVPLRAGLNRCRKSCRLRWTNYLKPNIKRGQFSEDEVDLIIRLHKLLGNRWSLIAGRIPGRTANDVKNYWNTHLHKKYTSYTRPPKHPNILSTNISIKNKKPPTFSTKTTSTNITLQAQIIRPRPLHKSSFTSMKLLEDVAMSRSNQTTNHPAEVPRLHKYLGENEVEEGGDDKAMWWKNLIETFEKEGNIDHVNGPKDGLGYEPNNLGGLNVWPTSSSEVPHWAISHVQEHNSWEDDNIWNFDINFLK